jgi:hypothetical protein
MVNSRSHLLPALLTNQTIIVVAELPELVHFRGDE